MPESEQTYTYRAGEKVVLEKRPDQFVVRALPEELEGMGIPDAEQVSSASSRVTARSTDTERMMSESRHVAPTHHAYYVADSGDEFLITDRVFVTFKEALPAEQVDDFAGRYGLVMVERYSDRDYLFQLTDHTGMNPVKLVVKLTEEEPQVESADHDLNQRMETYHPAMPTDPSYARQWHLHSRLIDSAFDTRSCSHCEEAWQLLDGFGSPNVVVGVTDDGCKLDHPDFDSPGKFAAWGYFAGTRLIANTDIDANPSDMYQTGSNHGTSCAGVIAGEADAVLTVGAAPGCRLLPIKWQSSGTSLFISDSKLLAALNFVADKVDVLSNSWGSVPNSTWAPLVVNRIAELAQTGGRRGQGIVFLWAAGNENCPINHTANVDVPYNSGWEFRPDGSQVWVGVRTARQFRNNLVGIPGLIHVAALASTARRSHYSNYGPGLMLCAPTNQVHKYRRLSLPGLGITTATGATGNVTTSFGGTSSATPLTAGIAALVISANPELSALDVVSILKQTAVKDLSFDAYPRTPAATFDPNPTWDVSPIAPFDQGAFQDNGDADGTWSPWFGYGRVDARNAVAEALRRRTESGPLVFRQDSHPDRSIPDNNVSGVRDTIHCLLDAALTEIEVLVDIPHTFIGDLRVTLAAPSGRAVLLHDRSGGGTDNLQQTFDLASTPGLSSLLDLPTQGDWTLQVQDLAARDRGRLQSWELAVEGRAVALVSAEDAPGVVIPDNRPEGIERALTIAESGRVKELQVTVDITHSFIGDLRATLVSPQGSEVMLHDRTGGPADNLIAAFTPATLPGLQALRGQDVQGAWRLHVADLAGLDVGKLNRWGLRVELEPES